VYNELPVQYCVYDRLLNHSRPSGILTSTCQKYWSLQYFGATLHIRHTASNHRTSLSLCRRSDRIALRLQEVVKKHVCQIDLPVNVRGTRSILLAETNGDFRVRDRRDYKGRLKSANDSNQTPLVLSRLLLFWRLLSDIVYAAPTKDMVEYSSTVRNTIYNIRKRTIGWKCFFCSDHKRKYEFGRNRHHQSQQPVRLLNE
jgi:hypothetical protein